MAKKAYIGVGGKNLANIVDQYKETSEGIIWESRNGTIYILDEGNSDKMGTTSSMTPVEIQTVLPAGTYTLYTKVSCDAYYAPVGADGSIGGRKYMFCGGVKTFTVDTDFVLSDLQLYLSTGIFDKFPITPMLLRGEYTLDTLPPEEPWRGGEYGVARKIKKGYIGVHKTPTKQYAVLDHIQSTGTQYIDFKFPIATKTFKIQMRASFTGTSSTEQPLISTWTSAYNYWNLFLNYDEQLSFYYASHLKSEAISVGAMHDIEFGTDETGVYGYSGKRWLTVDGKTVSATTSLASTNPTTLKLFARGDLNGTTSGKAANVKYYEGSTLAHDIVAVRRISDNAIGMYDRCTGEFRQNAGTGAFTAGPETGEYINDVPTEGYYARRIRKAYIGIGGVARPCWSGGELAYYGTVTPFSPEGGNSMASGTVGNYAVFAGGYGHNSNKAVDAYSRELIHSNPTELGTARTNVAGASVGNYFLTAGGYNGGSSKSVVETYDTNLTRGSATALPVNVYNSLCGQVKDYAIFAGGYDYGAKANRAEAVAYNESLTRQTITSLSKATSGTSSVSMDDYVIMTASAMAWAYHSDLTRVDIATGLTERGAFRGVKVGKNAVFAGGHNGSGSALSLVESYDENFTRTILDSLQTARFDLMATGLGDYAIFAGGTTGNTSSSARTSVAETYDINLTRGTTTSLNVARANGGNATIGDFALIASGSMSSGYSPVVDAFTLV